MGDSLRSMFLKKWMLHAATMYTMTSTPGVCRGGQPSFHVPEGEGTAVAEDILQPRLAHATKVFLYSVLALLQNCKMLIGGYPERLERGGHCGEVGTQRGQMKGVLSWLVRWGCHAGTRDFCSALAALVGPVQNSFSSPDTI